ncbi:zonular occludens toxin domain-containing protein [Candidatus Woesearchaeota archaeon]|nr:zonular occludens toxin domain-containing protein [Candidatus Woesearchaeota archaeon]
MGILDVFRNIGVKKDKEPYVPFEPAKTDKGSYDEFFDKLRKSSLILLIIGKRGSGKTSLGMKFLEFFHKEAGRKCYTLGYESTRLPWWLKKVDSIEKIPNNAIALFDEGAIFFSARESMKSINKELSKIMAVARHKNLTLVLITQNSAMIDLNVLRLADTLLLKEPSLLQSNFERKVLKDIYEKIRPVFAGVKEKKAYFYVWDDDFQGMVKYSLPYFWSEKVSKSFRNL